MSDLLDEMMNLLKSQEIHFPDKGQNYYGRFYIIFESYKAAMLREIREWRN